MIERIGGQFAPSAPSATPAPQTPETQGAFASQLDQAIETRQLRFSAHAQKRLASRGIELSPGHLQKLGAAVDKAQQRGARDSLVLLNDMGMIVNLPSRTVVTALDAARLSVGIVTNIDSTIVIRD